VGKFRREEIIGMSPPDLLRQAIEAARAGRRDDARSLLLMVIEIDSRNEIAWMWLSGLVDSLEDQIIACENVLTINPANERTRRYLAKLQLQKNALLAQKKTDDVVAAVEHESPINASNAETGVIPEAPRHPKTNPLQFAEQLEQEGKFRESLEAYKEQAAKVKNSREFDHIYKQIVRIERLQDERIQYVAPASTIARLTFTWPLLYLSLAFIQVGLNPFAHPILYLWLDFPWVLLGGFLLAISEVRSRHVIWQKLFLEEGSGSGFARMTTAVAGWLLVIIPHGLLILDSINRLRVFQIPPNPFPW